MRRDATTHGATIGAAFRAWALGVLVLGLVAGCSTAHYRRSADKEVYGILHGVEQQVLGRTNAFTIDTPYSGRDPKTIAPEEIIDGRSAANRLKVNLDQALDLAVRGSREYQGEKERLYATALTLTGVRQKYRPSLSADVAGQLAGTPDGLSSSSLGSRAALDQSFLLKTGGQLGVNLANDILKYYTGDYSRSIVNSISVDLTQPLLRGFGRNNAEIETLTQATRNVVYEVRSFNRYQQEFAVGVVSAYFSLLTQKAQVRNNYRSYTNKVETTKFLEARSVDRVPQSDVDDARSSELDARISYINSLASYLNQLDSFKLRLGLPLSTQLCVEDQDLTDLIGVGLVPVEVSRKAAFSLCVNRQMELLNAIDRFEDSKRKVRIAADQLRPDLNVFGSASLASEEPDDYTEFDLNKLRYTAGFTLNLPLDRRRERNTYRATLIAFESQLRSLVQSFDDYKNRIDRGLRTVEQSRLNYLNAVEGLKVAERRVENNSMRLEAGRTTILYLREAQDNLVRVQNILAGTYTAYLTARLELMLNIGVLDTRPGQFWLQDPLKDRLAPDQRGVSPLQMPEDQVLPPETFFEPAS
ncbi:MAG TPA: TolC family protein [Verrucomicrobiota bacterium]|nr:TolC family protein [Verrucomicrobiota bacterium]HNU49865.1 TolC family protein [Verrucomicrobiota bacterium]